jgi:hypothetical protein
VAKVRRMGFILASFAKKTRGTRPSIRKGQ